MKHNETANVILEEPFGMASLTGLATVEDGIPSVRTVDVVYIDGTFYSVTCALSGKMRQIAKNPAVAISGDWFTAHGAGENPGHMLPEENQKIMDKIRAAFAAWYDNVHTNEADPHTILLRIRLTGGVLFCSGTRYAINFI